MSEDTIDIDLLHTGRRRCIAQMRASNHVCVQEAMDLVKEQVFAREANVTYEQMPTVSCDGNQVVLLFQHLISNAITFSDRKPVVEIKARLTSVFCHVTVSDNGVGIPENELKHVMIPFHHLHKSDANDRVGIGLATCKKILDYHQGFVWLESD